MPTLRFHALLLLGLSLLAPTTAFGTPITWVYEGNVQANPLLPGIPDGTLLRMSWTFDSEQQNACSASANAGFFSGQDAVVELGPYVYQTQLGFLAANVHYDGNCNGPVFYPVNELRFPGWSGPALSDVSGNPAPVESFQHGAPNGFFWVEQNFGEFPSSPPPSGYFDGPMFRVSIPSPLSPFTITGFSNTQMQFVQAVAAPEPGTLVLIASGAGAALLRRRKNQNRRQARDHFDGLQ